MSFSLSLYLLDVAATRALIGSGDDRLLEVVRSGFADELARDDDYRGYEIGQGAPSAEEALRAVIHGGPFKEDQDHACQYGYAYERLCSFTGTFLPNDRFTPHRGDWLSVVDQGLSELGVTAVSVESFSHGGPPAPLPHTFAPGCGEWHPDHISQALDEYAATTREGAEAGVIPAREPEVAEAVTQCLGWMRCAKARPGLGVIGFRS